MQKLENDIRDHISFEQEVKIHIEKLEYQLEDYIS